MMNNGRPFVSVTLIRAIVKAAEHFGLTAEELLAEVGMSVDLLADPDAFVAGDIEEALWRVLVERVDADDIAVQAATRLGTGQFRGIEYLVRSCANLRQALEHLARFADVLHGRPIFALDQTADRAWIVYESPHDITEPYAHVVAEYALVTVFWLGEDATATEWKPRSVSFEHPPRDIVGLSGFFDAPVFGGAPRCEIELDARTLDAPMARADPELFDVLKRYVRGLLDAAMPHDAMTIEVRRRIEDALPTEPVLEEIANALGLSSRRLQSSLALERTSFRVEVDGVRRRLAERWLGRPELTIFEIATMLGYSDATAFQRAFKRWTGATPGSFREDLQ